MKRKRKEETKGRCVELQAGKEMKRGREENNKYEAG